MVAFYAIPSASRVSTTADVGVRVVRVYVCRAGDDWAGVDVSHPSLSLDPCFAANVVYTLLSVL